MKIIAGGAATSAHEDTAGAGSRPFPARETVRCEVKTRGIRLVEKAWRVGVLTGGGDSSGINAFLRALCVGVWKRGGEVIGIRNGWKGLVEPDLQVLTPADVLDVTLKPGTILGTSRTNVVKMGAVNQVVQNIEGHGLTHLVVIGGGDTLSIAGAVADESPVPVVAVPQTIDNDIAETDVSLGFSTAVQRGIEAVSGIIPSNRAHGNPMLVEVMGRASGWLTLHIALGLEADFVALPEFPWSVDDLVEVYERTGPAILALIAEGVQTAELQVTHSRFDAFGNPALEGVVHRVAARFAERAGRYPRVQVLGYVLRGGPPNSFDLNLAWRFAVGTLRALEENVTGHMVAWRDGTTRLVPLGAVVGRERLVPAELFADFRRVMVR